LTILRSIILVFNSVAIWSSVPLTLRLFTAIKDRRSLYFRAMLLSSWGLTLRAIAYWLRYFSGRGVPWWLFGLMTQGGWVCMVSGFALVLWSRLGFVLHSERVKKWLLCMIVGNGVVFHTAMTVLGFGVWAMLEVKDQTTITGRMRRFPDVQRVFECIQIVAFNGQELLLASLYIRAAYIYLRDWSALGAAGSRRKVRRAMILLLTMQGIVVFIDVAIITIDLLGLIQMKGMIHSFIYCVKLELEFLVLNQLVEISKLGVPGLPTTTTDRSGEITMENTESRPPSDLELNQQYSGDSAPGAKWDMRMHVRQEVRHPCVPVTAKGLGVALQRHAGQVNGQRSSPP
jgi:hypothetical protein